MDYITCLKALVERSSLFAGKDVRITIIANPMAGGFSIKRRAMENRAVFDQYLRDAQAKPVLTRSASIELLLTDAPGHARQIARAVIGRILCEKRSKSVDLVVTAGGDGTSLDVQTELARAFFEDGSRAIAERVVILRLPYGTGNDGSDGRTLVESLDKLVAPARIERQRAVRVHGKRNRDRPWYSFNIASIGLDAFVTHMTNKLKGRFPGDFYKLWVDLACVFSDKAYRVGTMRIRTGPADGAVALDVEGRFLLCLMGASGNRTYGSNQRILPDERNVCAVREMSLFRKLRLKGMFLSGRHAGLPEAILSGARRMEIDYGETILAQFDGESHRLKRDDFPLVMELTEPFINVIKKE